MSSSLLRAALLIGLSSLATLSPGCSSEGGLPLLGERGDELTKQQRVERYTVLRDVSAQRGMPGRGFLLAGIAYAETGLVHCWSEATWACQGPSSPDCGGGPVIAGAGDGACSLQQGGLGMFQFDAGTFTDTINKYSSDVLLLASNISHAVDYVTNMVKISAYTTNAETDAKALQWLATFDINDSTKRDQWVKTVTHYYNGCKPTYSCWDQRYKHYNDSLQYVIDDVGLDFWMAAAAKPDFKGTFVSQTFPFASQPFVLKPGQTSAGYIELRNDGASAWKPGEVFLGTTQPRDAPSPLVAPGWVSPSRAATVEQETPPGGVGRFSFSVKAPAQLGDFPQFFGLVREGVAWFSDAGQGGPPDDQLQVKVTVEAAPCPAGLGAEWVCQGNERARCEPSTGAVSTEPCPHGCEAKAGGAQCAPPPAGAGGSAGNPGSAGSPGSAGKPGSAGAPGAGGAPGSAGGGNKAGAPASGGAAGKAPAQEDEPSAVVLTRDSTDDESGTCGCRAAGSRGGAAGWLVGLALLAARGRRQARRQPQ